MKIPYNSPEEALVVMSMVVNALDEVVPGRYSAPLVNQLVYTPYSGMNFLYQFVIDEIKHLESPNLETKTVKEECFRRPKMKGLWKKHFYLPQFMAKNMQNYWGLSPGAKSSKFEDRFRKEYHSLQKPPTDEAAMKFSSWVAEVMISETNQKKKTGEYIVYQKHKGDNYYLCLGLHGQDDDTLAWVRHAHENSFPFLKGSIGENYESH